MDCMKCPFFEKQKNKIQKGIVIIGFCKLRNKFINDINIGKEFCRDRATIDKLE